MILLKQRSLRIDQLLPILQLCAKRMVRSQLPSCVRSFCLPIAYAMSVEKSLDLLKALGDLPTLLWTWIEYTPKFTDDASKLSYMGLASVLKLTQNNIEFAALRIKKGGEYSSSNETILLQTKLVHCFSQFLEA